MAMNFVTFNQDYSHLAVGKLEMRLLMTLAVVSHPHPDLCRLSRHIQGFPNIYDGTVREEL
jgi:hypothetical protein